MKRVLEAFFLILCEFGVLGTVCAIILLVMALFLPIRAHAADVNLVAKIIQCESSGRTNVWGDDKKSFGIAQFRKETFYEFAKMAKLKHANYKSPAHQMILLTWGLDHGYGRRWTCYRKLKHERGDKR